MKQLESMITTMASRCGKNVRDIFCDLLKYMTGAFDPCGEPDASWRYTKEQNVAFYDMMKEYFVAMKGKLKDEFGWYDAWGDIFMSLNVAGNNKGQFFTPSGLCDLMADISIKDGEEPQPSHSIGAFGKRVTISDCSCGSGRNLLSANSAFLRNGWRKPYLVGEDIDLDCCRMTAINMMAHGCFGEVVCHNTLSDPKGLRVGYIINEGLYPMPNGFPTIRECKDPNQFYLLRDREY